MSSLLGSPHLLNSLPTSGFVSTRAVVLIISLVHKEYVFFQPSSNKNPKGMFCISSFNLPFILNPLEGTVMSHLLTEISLTLHTYRFTSFSQILVYP